MPPVPVDRRQHAQGDPPSSQAAKGRFVSGLGEAEPSLLRSASPHCAPPVSASEVVGPPRRALLRNQRRLNARRAAAKPGAPGGPLELQRGPVRRLSDIRTGVRKSDLQLTRGPTSADLSAWHGTANGAGLGPRLRPSRSPRLPRKADGHSLGRELRGRDGRPTSRASRLREAIDGSLHGMR